MRRLSFRTAGESHGRTLIAILEGIPAGLSVSMEKDVDPELRRRQGGHGRGRRMQIETDRADLLAGVRLGETLGSPIAMVVWNKDADNWTAAMSPVPPDPEANPTPEDSGTDTGATAEPSQPPPGSRPDASAEPATEVE